jgi:hypothetical protein
VSFTFTSDGQYGIALMGNGKISSWKIGYRFTTVEAINSEIPGIGEPYQVVGLSGSKIAVLGQKEYREIDLITLTDCEKKISSGDSIFESISVCGDMVILVVRREASEAWLLLFEADSVEGRLRRMTTVPVHGDINRVLSIISVQSPTGRLGQYNVYYSGTTSGGHIWTAQTIDVTEWKSEGENPLNEDELYNERTPINDDYSKSDSSKGPDEVSPPDRLLSSSSGSLREILAEQDRMLHSQEFKEIIEQEIRDRVSELITMELRQQRDSVSRILRDKFRNGLNKTMVEIENQLLKKIATDFDRFNRWEFESVRNTNRALSNRLDSLLIAMDAELVRLKGAVNLAPLAGDQSPVLVDIRRYINSGDHFKAIEVACHWWRNSTGDESDLLAITCGAIAPQIKPAHSIVDMETGCYVLLVLTEWIKANSGAHADRTVAVLRSARYIVSCLLVSWTNISGDGIELCARSLSKSIRNSASSLNVTDRIVEELSRELLTDIRELLMKFNIRTPSRDATPRASPGTNILQLLQSGSCRR